MLPNKNTERTGYIQIFITGILWGCIGYFIHLLSEAGSTPVLTSLLRMSFALVIIGMVTVAKFGIGAFRISRRAIGLCLLLGLLCHGFYNIIFSLAVELTGVTISTILMNTAPIFTMAASVILLNEKISALKIVAMLINIIGCMLVATGGSVEVLVLSWFGILCGLGSGFCYGMTAIFGKMAGSSENPFVISTYTYLIATLFLVFFMGTDDWALVMNTQRLTLGFLYALIPTVLAYIFYFEGLSKITESSKVPVIASVEAVIAALIGVFILDEQIGTMNIFGITLVLISIMLINYRR